MRLRWFLYCVLCCATVSYMSCVVDRNGQSRFTGERASVTDSQSGVWRSINSMFRGPKTEGSTSPYAAGSPLPARYSCRRNLCMLVRRHVVALHQGRPGVLKCVSTGKEHLPHVTGSPLLCQPGKFSTFSLRQVFGQAWMKDTSRHCSPVLLRVLYGSSRPRCAYDVRS